MIYLILTKYCILYIYLLVLCNFKLRILGASHIVLQLEMKSRWTSNQCQKVWEFHGERQWLKASMDDTCRNYIPYIVVPLCLVRHQFMFFHITHYQLFSSKKGRWRNLIYCSTHFQYSHPWQMFLLLEKSFVVAQT